MDAPESKHLRQHWLMRVLLGKAFIIAVALMITYTMAGFFLAPYLIKRQATRFAREFLKCLVIMEEVRVNPYALTLDIRNFDLKERDGSPLLAFNAFFINFEISSPWRWACPFADVRLEGPAVNLEIMSGAASTLLILQTGSQRKKMRETLPGKKKAEREARPPRVIFEHIALNQGRLVFTDRSGPTPGSIALETIGLELKARGDREPILSVDTIRLDDGRFSLASRSFEVGELALSRGRATAVIDEQERLSWQELVKVGGDPRSPALRQRPWKDRPGAWRSRPSLLMLSPWPTATAAGIILLK